MKLNTSRKAFSLLTSIIVIFIMASIGALVMSLSGKLVKETTAQFQREQAMLLAKSYTEYAIMAVMSNDRNGTSSCLHTINSDNVLRNENNGGFEVRVNIAYIGNGNGEIDACTTVKPIAVLSNAAVTEKSPLNIILDVYVKYKDFDHHDPGNEPWITYHKRTLQKI